MLHVVSPTRRGLARSQVGHVDLSCDGKWPARSLADHGPVLPGVIGDGFTGRQPAGPHQHERHVGTGQRHASDTAARAGDGAMWIADLQAGLEAMNPASNEVSWSTSKRRARKAAGLAPCVPSGTSFRTARIIDQSTIRYGCRESRLDHRVPVELVSDRPHRAEVLARDEPPLTCSTAPSGRPAQSDGAADKVGVAGLRRGPAAQRVELDPAMVAAAESEERQIDNINATGLSRQNRPGRPAPRRHRAGLTAHAHQRPSLSVIAYRCAPTNVMKIAGVA